MAHEFLNSLSVNYSQRSVTSAVGIDSGGFVEV
jgi:hypothetical protein